MPIPPLSEFGLLPDGTFDTDLQEVSDRYCGNPNRQAIWEQFLQFCDAELRPRNWSHTVLIDGGFTSNKPWTKDIDVILDMTASDPLQVLHAIDWQSRNHDQIEIDYKVDFWVFHPLLPNDLTAFFRYVKEKERLQRGAPPDVRKGLLRVTI